MRRRYASHEITSAIRPQEGVYAGRTSDGVWVFYAAKGVCFIKERVEACALMRWCTDSESDMLEILELSGHIACIPVSTPEGVCAFAQRLM